MSVQGPLVVISATQNRALVAALGSAGAFPVIEVTADKAMDAIAASKAEAVVLADAQTAADSNLASVLSEHITAAAPIVPVIARVVDGTSCAYREAFPVMATMPARAVSAALAAALRVKNLHRSVLRRAELVKTDGLALPVTPKNDPLGDATIVVAGRGRSYPTLCMAIGERAGLIGALTIETAAHYLKQREIDGLVIGDGFAATAVDGLLTVLSEDNRFRDLPIAVLARVGMHFDYELNLVVSSDPATLVAHLFPYVRLHAFEARLRRVMTSLDHDGIVDPDTGLLRPDAFLRELDRALLCSVERSAGLSLARFAFPEGFGQRASMDAARLVSRLIRGGDFACRQDDGSVLVAFGETDLRHAHVVARRLASVLKYTMLNPDQEHEPVAPAVTLAGRKSHDTLQSLLTRVIAPAIAAA